MTCLLRGARFAVVAAIGCCCVAGCSPNAQQTKATVSYIDRKCQIIETEYDENYKRKGSRACTDSCNSIDEWDKVREKRNKVVDGSAVVHVSYTAPQNGQSQTAELNFNGRDDEFYRLKAGDEIDILVSNSDPTKISKA
jgi:hypothetical protein